MTGNNRRALQLNYSAGEARDRTVASYCLGKVSDVNGGEPRRPVCETTLAATFSNENSQQVSIGLLLSVDAAEQSGEEVKSRFVVRGHGFSIRDFVERDADGNEFVPTHDTLTARMKERFGKGITFHSNSKAFVAEYLTAMRPKNTPAPERFLRSFAVALSAKEIQDPTDFVRRFVLEPRPLDIQGVRQSIRTWNELQDEVRRLEEMLQAGRAVRARFANLASHRIGAETQTFLACHTERMLLERSIKADQIKQSSFEEKHTRLQAEIKDIQASIDRLIELNRRDSALAATSDEARRRQTLDEQLKTARTQIQALSRPLQEAVLAYTRGQHLKRLDSFLPAYARAAAAAAVELAALTSKDAPVNWADQGTEMRLMAERIRKALPAEQALRQQFESTTEEISKLRAEAAGLEAQLAAAGAGGPLLSPETIAFRAELAKRGIQAVALPDVVDVSDPDWAFALEALLGPHREALIVPDEQVDEAFEILFRNRHRFDGCRLVNTRKTRTLNPRVPANSIAEIAVTSDPDARIFIENHVGRFQRAENQHELERMENGILRNGKSSSGLSLRVFRDRRPILGRTAQAAALETARQRLTEVRDALKGAQGTEQEGLENKQRLLQSGLQCLDLISAAPDPARLEEDARALEDARVRAAGLVQDIKNIAGTHSNELMEAIAERGQRIAGMREDIDAANTAANLASKDVGAIQERINTAISRSAKLTEREAELAAKQLQERERRIIEVAGIKDTILSARERVQNLLGIEWTGREEEELRKLKLSAEAGAAKHQDQLKEGPKNRAEREFYDFIQKFVGLNPLPPEADEADKLFWLDTRVERLERHELLPHREQVAKARQEVEAMLKEDLLTKLNERLEFGRVQLDALNRRLAGRTFVGQSYSFSRRMNERLKPLADLAKKVASTPEIGFGALSREKEVELKGAIDHIEKIVTNEEDTREIEDYRNYSEYDLEIRSVDGRVSDFSKTMGTLSGGQRQAPYYVAIAASMLSAYYPGGRAGDTDGLGLVLFDEAFNKLDVRNTQALLELFRGLGLQIVVAAPEAHRPTFLECVDTLISVVRQPSTEDVILKPTYPGPEAKAAMRRENPEHIGVEGFRAARAQQMIAAD